MTTSSPQFPGSQRTSYQFPVYRWIGWLAVAGFAMGLIMMFFVSGMFGVPAPIGWAALVTVFTFGALLLDRPKMLLNVMLFYFLLVPSNRLFGLISLPIPGGMNKLFFIPFIAVIVMNWIQRRRLSEATFFPAIFCLLTALSWYVNGRSSMFTVIQLTLIMLRCYILWYYCRLTCTFESERQLGRWTWGYIVYVAIQFFYNVLWQRAPWTRFHPDISGGVFGPLGGGLAHYVGYMSVFGLLLITGWWVSSGRLASSRKRWWAFWTAIVIAYNLIFMTDTKHVLILFPFIALPFLLHPRLSIRLKISLLITGSLFLLGAMVYLNHSVGKARFRQFLNSTQNSPKSRMLYAVTVDFPHLVPYPLLGAGPGKFMSLQAVAARTPLARRYVIPYEDENRRRGYFGLQGSVLSASVVGATQSDLFILMGEYGWLATIVFYSFWFWLIVKLFRKSNQLPQSSLQSGLCISLACCLLAQAIFMSLAMVLLIPPLMYPVWILLGRMWDMKQEGDSEELRDEVGNSGEPGNREVSGVRINRRLPQLNPSPAGDLRLS